MRNQQWVYKGKASAGGGGPAAAMSSGKWSECITGDRVTGHVSSCCQERTGGLSPGCSVWRSWWPPQKQLPWRGASKGPVREGNKENRRKETWGLNTTAFKGALPFMRREKWAGDEREDGWDGFFTGGAVVVFFSDRWSKNTWHAECHNPVERANVNRKQR